MIRVQSTTFKENHPFEKGIKHFLHICTTSKGLNKSGDWDLQITISLHAGKIYMFIFDLSSDSLAMDGTIR